MTFFELLAIGIGLAMDAFAVSICKGLCMNKIEWKKASIIALFFGLFQSIMPILGFIVSTRIEEKVSRYGHYIASFLLDNYSIVQRYIESIIRINLYKMFFCFPFR